MQNFLTVGSYENFTSPKPYTQLFFYSEVGKPAVIYAWFLIAVYLCDFTQLRILVQPYITFSFTSIAWILKRKLRRCYQMWLLLTMTNKNLIHLRPKGRSFLRGGIDKKPPFDTEKVQEMLSNVSCLEDLTGPGGVMQEMLKNTIRD